MPSTNDAAMPIAFKKLLEALRVALFPFKQGDFARIMVATRSIAPVEDIIVEGDLVGSSALIKGHGRVSGMKLGARMVLLAADYFGKSNGSLKLFLDIPEKSQLRDLLTGEIIGKALAAGTHTIILPLNGEQARLLEILPRE